jgi:hypothetical protein
MFTKLTAPVCLVIAGCLLIAWAVTGDAIAQSASPKSFPATQKAKPAKPVEPLAGGGTPSVEKRGRIGHDISYCEVEPPCPTGCKHDTVNRICVEASR